ncbi:MAG: cupin domain-containing protein [Betaproteobacteria bacterium]
MKSLGTLDELPHDYVAALAGANLVPLWPSLRALLPPQAPRTSTLPTHWRWSAIRPLLLRAGELTPMEKAERRVLVLANPGRGLDNLQASATIYLGMQLVLPGETAPSHRHTPNAARVVVEGEGAVTLVDGEPCAMEPGDLILTPTGQWHEHRHQGKVPVIWLDVLDLPLMVSLDVSYAVEGSAQAAHSPSFVYAAGGLAPLAHGRRAAGAYPLLRYEWRRTRDALQAYAAACAPGAPIQLAYVNPETGADCLNTLAFAALLLRPGEEIALPHVSAARVFHAVEGGGDAQINQTAMAFEQADTFCAPGLATVRLANRSSRAPAYLVMADESPLQRKLGVYEQR